MKCDICGNKENYVKLYNHSFENRGIKIEFQSNRRFCSKCNNLVYDEELDSEASKKAIRLYNKKMGIDPQKIIDLRKSYNLSQQQFSKIIGCAKKTLVSYELGNSIPNDIYIVTLKTLIDNPEIIYNMFDSNKERFSEKEYKSISNKLSIFVENNGKFSFQLESKEPTEYNGYTDFSFTKVIDLVKILAKDTILKTKLLKEMFYCDFYTYKNYGYSITGLEYAKLPFGPVPNEFETIIEKLIVEGIIDYKVSYNGNYESHLITSIDDNINSLEKEEIDIIKKVQKQFENYNSKKIVEYSHKEKAFKETEFLQNISYDYAFDIEDI